MRNTFLTLMVSMVVFIQIVEKKIKDTNKTKQTNKTPSGNKDFGIIKWLYTLLFATPQKLSKSIFI